jgi:primosomal protein N' (replication factor Y)
MFDRKKFYYPPYVKLVKITTRHTDFKVAEKAAHALHREMASIQAKKIVLGPEKGLIGRIKNQYQFESMVKLDKSGNTQAIFKENLGRILADLQSRQEFRSVRWVVDVDPS